MKTRQILGQVSWGKRQAELWRRRNFRRARFETLEDRSLLSITLPAIGNFSVPVGAPVPVELLGSDTQGGPLTYDVQSGSDAIQPILTAASNPVVKISVAGFGDMTFQLYQDLAPDAVSRFLTLVNNKTYDNTLFYRVSPRWVIQGGLQSSGTAPQFDDQFDPNLQFTRRGVLAMANRGPDTNTSEYFITDVPTASDPRQLDHRYTIIGFLTSGEDVRAAIQAVAVNGETPQQEVKVTSMSVVNGAQSTVVLLSAPQMPANVGPVTMTVTVRNNYGDVATRTFQATPVADTDAYANAPPYIPKMDPIQTPANTPTSFDIPTVDADRDSDTVPPTYSAKLTAANPSLAVSVDTKTGRVTLTPADGITGVYGVQLGVVESASDGTARKEDTQIVPIFINPAAPTSVTLLNGTGDGSRTALDNSPSKLLQFRVTGLLPNAPVTIFADGTQIGSGTADASGNADVTTDGSHPLSEGPHAITAKQTLRQTNVRQGNWSAPQVDMLSRASPTLPITVVLAPPQFAVGAQTFTVTATDLFSATFTAADGDLPRDALQFSFAGGRPAGAALQQVDAQTVQLNWQTQESDGNQSSVMRVRVTDAAGQTADVELTVYVNPLDRAPVFVRQDIPRQAVRGSAVIGQVEANDPDLVDTKAIQYDLLPGAPEGAAIDPFSGAIIWDVPADFPLGSVQIGVQATEQSPTGKSTVVYNTLTVVDVPPPATFTSLLGVVVNSVATTLSPAATQPVFNAPATMTFDPYAAIPRRQGMFGESNLFGGLLGGQLGRDCLPPTLPPIEPTVEPGGAKPSDRSGLDRLPAEESAVRRERFEADDAAFDLAALAAVHEAAADDAALTDAALEALAEEV